MAHFIMIYWSYVAIQGMHVMHFMAHFILPALADMAMPIGAIAFVLLATMAYGPTRRVTVAVTRYTKRHAPKWLLPLLTVCAFIPGPLDEMLLIVAVLATILRTRHQRRVFTRTVSYAWHER
jgi:hypothetical protein